jgi:P-type E1-E2 ATPase
MIFELPHEKIEIKTIVLDLNGVLSVNGKIPRGAKKRLKKLRELGYKIILFTGNQRGHADKICGKLGIEYEVTPSAKEKETAILKHDPKTCAAIGNARIDIGTLKHAKVSVLTIQAEGIHTETIKYADIIVPSINDALDLFINKDSFLGTMKK